MVYLLRSLILLMAAAIGGTTLVALGWIPTSSTLQHIQLGLVSFIYTIFAQAFVMFYFIGVARLTENVYRCLQDGGHLDELFDSPPPDIAPYKKKVYQFVLESKRFKRQTIPWSMLMLILGSIAFLLGGAHHTGMAEKSTHAGTVYGFLAAMIIGFFRQWHYLGKGHLLLRKLKGLFQIPEPKCDLELCLAPFPFLKNMR